LGQKRPVQVYALITEGTIEESLLGTLSAKHELAMAALDLDSDVDAVDVVSNAEELRRRMEILLGAKPDAPIDESQEALVDSKADQRARRERVAAASGQLLGAAFSFLSELLPDEAPNTQTKRMADSLKQRLTECVDKDDAGRLNLTVTLPGAADLDKLAESLARLLSYGQSATAVPGKDHHYPIRVDKYLREDMPTIGRFSKT